MIASPSYGTSFVDPQKKKKRKNKDRIDSYHHHPMDTLVSWWQLPHIANGNNLWTETYTCSLQATSLAYNGVFRAQVDCTYKNSGLYMLALL